MCGLQCMDSTDSAWVIQTHAFIYHPNLLEIVWFFWLTEYVGNLC